MPDCKPTIVFVDDEPSVLDGIRRHLRPFRHEWSCAFANSVHEGIKTAVDVSADLIVTDMSMPGEDGLDLLRQVTCNERLVGVPVVMLTGNAETDLKRRALDLGALDLLSKPIRADDLVARIASAIRLRAAEFELRTLNENLERLVAERTADLEYSRLEIVWRLAKAGEMRDTDTGEHLFRVAGLSKELSLVLGWSEQDAAELYHASALHDIGKIGISDTILLKPGPLTDEERKTMCEHCRLGHSILADEVHIPGLPRTTNVRLALAAEIALAHHERWDGQGYPNGLAGEQIPHSARIVAVADVFDSLCSVRPYKDAMPREKAAAIIQSDSGTHFDPEVVAAFEDLLPHIDSIYDPVAQVPASGQELRDAA